MLFRHRMASVACLLLVLVGCERARRWPPTVDSGESKTVAPKEKEASTVPAHYGWRPAQTRLDIPIRFVADNSSEWPALKELWNEFPGRAGLRTWPIGLSPLEAALAFGAQVEAEVIKIKVPRGLPDPNDFIPAANSPTYGSWLLGKKLFFDQSLLVMSTNPGAPTRSCADCHTPETAYTVHTAKPVSGKWNVPSLINSVYNRHQFWDGRATALEEVLQRRLSDQDFPIENPPTSPGYLHIFPGLIGRLHGKEHYNYAFTLVYGHEATVDSVAKALATYMRTLLSGDSVFDRADENKRKRKGETLAPEDVETALSPAALERLPTSLPLKEAAQQIARGYALFHGQARCYECHAGKLFTDDGFHNIGVGESADLIAPGQEPGRFAHLPDGLKDPKSIGAFKTPSLRNLQLTGPFMHTGGYEKIADVLAYFNEGISAESNPHLDPLLLQRPSGGTQPAEAVRLGLRPADLADLELFLKSLRGNDLPTAYR